MDEQKNVDLAVAPEPAVAEALWTAKEVADFLRIKPTTVYDLVRQGVLPRVRVGKREMRFSPKALRAWVDEQSMLPKRKRRG